MNTGRKILLWAPRVLLIAFALFLVVFSFDVFDADKGAMETAAAFALHNIPTAILGLVVIAAWRREWIGAVSCLVLALAYIAWSWSRFPPVTYVVLTGPMFVVAALYELNWKLRNQARRTR